MHKVWRETVRLNYRTVFGRHIRNIYKEEELEKDITCAKFAHMGKEGDQPYEYTAYNLGVI